MRKLKGVIFDVDGTLAETEDTHLAAFNEVFSRWELDWHWDRPLYKELLKVGGSRERIRHYATNWKPEGAVKVNSDDELVRMHKEKTAIYSDMVSSGQVTMRPGVERLIEELFSAGLKCGIATTTNIGPLEALFKGTLGLDTLARFHGIAAGDMVKNKKPAPDLFLMAMEKMELGAENCLAVEDSQIGFKAAKSAGLEAIITVNDYTRHLAFPEAMAVMSDLGEPDAFFQPVDGLASEPDYIRLELLNGWFEKRSVM